MKIYNHKIIALLLAGLIAISLITPALTTAYGDETGAEGSTSSEETTTPYVPVETDLGEINIKIKEGTTDNLETLISRYIRDNNEVPSGYAVITSGDSLSSRAGSTGTTKFTLRMVNKDTYVANVNWEVVAPEGYVLATEVANIYANDANNRTASTLLSYINKDLTLEPQGSVFNNALGTAKAYRAKSFTWNNADIDYDPYGGVTYIFSNDYDGNTIVRTVTVKEVIYNTPNVWINYSNSTLMGTDTDMSYSIDGIKWQKCTSNVEINRAWYDKVIYFKYVETPNTLESGTDSLYIPPKADPPSAKIELEATSHSVTIKNCWDFEGVEYSINGYNWYTSNNSTYTFTGLRPNTKYTVYVRVAADPGDWLASDSENASITTSEATTDNVNVTYETTKRTATIKAVGTVASDISSTSMTGSYNTSTLTKLKQVVSSLINNYDVTTNFVINHYTEDGETYNINNYSFSIPLSPLSEAIKKSDFTMTYKNDLMDIIFDNADMRYYINKSTGYTLSISIQKPDYITNSSAMQWLKGQFNKNRPIYKVSVKAGYNYDDANVTYVIPYKLKANETIPGVSVYGVDSQGKKYDLMAEYDFIEECFRVTTDFQGYIVIVRDSDAEVMPFVDVPTTSWAYNTIKYCYNRGIFAGTSKTTFNPNDSITRAHIFTLLARISNVDLDKIEINKNMFTDIDEDHWAYRQAHWALQQKLISSGEFRPNETMTRAEITTYLYKMMINEGVKDTVTKDDKIENYYTDMDKQKSDAKKAAIFMYKYGIMRGIGDNKFDPDSEVTRAHMATILYRINDVLENLE